MKKIFKRILVTLLCMTVTLVSVFLIVFRNEIRTIKSLETYKEKNLYSLQYFGDYGFNKFINQGAKDWDEYGDFIRKNIAHGISQNIDVTGTKCSSFVARNEKGEVLFCRNFDYSFAPVVMTTTTPSKGYSSLCACELGFINFGRNEIIEPHKLNMTNALTLMCPYFTTDGMNEYGVAMSVLDCGKAYLPEPLDAPTMVTCSMIRMILENARNVDEAVDLFKSYNISSEKPNHHFMIADSSGKSVVMEYTQDGIIAVETNIVTNFDLYDEKHLGTGMNRYVTIQNKLQETGGVLSEEEAFALLSEVGVKGHIQYSTVYNLTTGKVYAFTIGDNSMVEEFALPLVSEDR